MALFVGFVGRLRERGVEVILCGVRPELYQTFRRSDLHWKLDKKNIFREQKVRQTSTLLAIRYACELLGDQRCPKCPPRDAGGPGLYYST
jgi:sulfate permease, SulP family